MFVVEPIPKNLRGIDDLYDPFDGFPLDEVVMIRYIQIKYVDWVRRSLDNELLGDICI